MVNIVSVVYGIFAAALFGILLIYLFFENNNILLVGNGSVDTAFQDTMYILVPTTVMISVTIPIAIELMIDHCLKWNSGICDKIERLFMISLTIFSGLIIILCSSCNDFPIIFCCAYLIQSVGYYGCILLLCHKLVSEYFTGPIITIIQLLYAISSIFRIAGLGQPLNSWSNIFYLIPLSLSYIIYISITIVWIQDLNFGNNIKIGKLSSKLSINEISCLLYVISAFLTLILFPTCIGIIHTFQYEKYQLTSILLLIISFIIFQIFPCCIPSRISKYFYSEQMMKRAALRYLSHEIRSPLNVICNGISFTLQDLTKYGCDPEILDNMFEIQNTSLTAVSLLNDLIEIDRMESGLFDITTRLVPLAEVMNTILKPLGHFAKQKGFQFVLDTSMGGVNIKKFGVFIDKIKIEHVLRNLITNSASYTTLGETITISVQIESQFDEGSSAAATTINGAPSSSTRESRGSRTILEHFVDSYPAAVSLNPITAASDPTSPPAPSPPPTAMASMHQSVKRVISRNSWMTDDSIHNNYSNSNYYNDNSGRQIRTLRRDPPAPTPTFLVIEVLDTGTGIPENIQSQIFQDNYRLDSQKLQGGRGGGSGLGLRICKEIIERHCGQLSILKGPNNKGTKIQIKLNLSPIYTTSNQNETTSRNLASLYRKKSIQSRVHPISSLSMLGGSGSGRLVWSMRKYYENDTANTTATNQNANNESSTRNGHLKNESNEDNVTQINAGDQKISSTSSENMLSDQIIIHKCDTNTFSPLIRSCRLHVLVVDDSDLNRKMVTKSIRRSLQTSVSAVCWGSSGTATISPAPVVDITFREVNDGLPAVETVRQSLSGPEEEARPFDIIFMDNVMIHMNGPDAARAMRALGYTGPIIGVTGNALSHDIQEFIESGADFVLKKPVDLRELRKSLEDLLPKLFRSDE